MVPSTILSKLSALRTRERALRVLWGFARVLAIALGLFVLACLVDYAADRWEETPLALRVLLLVGQVAVFLALVAWWVVRPLFMGLSDPKLATWVERTAPQFNHRLVTAVELNAPGAKTAGMSPVLIEQVTREAEDQAREVDFNRAVDARRMLWSPLTLGPVIVFALGLFLLFPAAARALVARQMLANVEVPRTVDLAFEGVRTAPAEPIASRDTTQAAGKPGEAPVLPAGDAVEVRIRAWGIGVREGMRGKLRLEPEGQTPETYPLEWEKWGPKGPLFQEAIFVARVPSVSVNFSYKAYLADGRLRESGKVVMTPRPAVDEFAATTLLPEYCGRRPNGSRYEQDQPKGDISGLLGSRARVTMKCRKNLSWAAVELLGSQGGGPEQRLREPVEMEKQPDGSYAAAFDLRPDESTYRILVRDEYGYCNSAPPRRAVGIQPDEAPVVGLLPERYDDAVVAPGGDDAEEGIPILFGSQFRVAYRAQGAVPVSSAVFKYRINEGDWQTFPLRRTEPSRENDPGPFDLSRGVFQLTSADDEVEFHAVKSPDPDKVPAALQAGGRFDFKTKSITGLKIGDKVEFYVEVTDARPTALVGKSEVRLKEVVEADKLVAWLQARKRERERIQALEAKQSGLFRPDGSEIPK